MNIRICYVLLKSLYTLFIIHPCFMSMSSLPCPEEPGTHHLVSISPVRQGQILLGRLLVSLHAALGTESCGRCGVELS